MKALLLAAGFGTRLHPLTQNTPKCLMRVGDKPMLDHWLYKLERLGVTEFIINTHYLAEKVHDFIDSHSLKSKIKLSFEPKLLGTAQTVLCLKNQLRDSPFFIVHVDNFCEDDLSDFLYAHKSRPVGTTVSMLTFDTLTPEQCGIVEIDQNNTLIKFYEKQKPPPSNKANGAVYIVSENFFDELEDLPVSAKDFSKCIIPQFLGKIFCFHTDRYFEDIGTPEALKRANEFHAGY